MSNINTSGRPAGTNAVYTGSSSSTSGPATTGATGSLGGNTVQQASRANVPARNANTWTRAIHRSEDSRLSQRESLKTPMRGQPEMDGVLDRVKAGNNRAPAPAAPQPDIEPVHVKLAKPIEGGDSFGATRSEPSGKGKEKITEDPAAQASDAGSRTQGTPSGEGPDSAETKRARLGTFGPGRPPG